MLKQGMDVFLGGGGCEEHFEAFVAETSLKVGNDEAVHSKRGQLRGLVTNLTIVFFRIPSNYSE